MQDLPRINSWDEFLDSWTNAKRHGQRVSALYEGFTIPLPRHPGPEFKEAWLSEIDRFFCTRLRFYLDLARQAQDSIQGQTLPNIARQLLITKGLQWSSSYIESQKLCLAFLAEQEHPKWMEKGPYHKKIGDYLYPMYSLCHSRPVLIPMLGDVFINAMLVWGMAHLLVIEKVPRFRQLTEDFLAKRELKVFEAFGKLGEPGFYSNRSSLCCASDKTEANIRAAHTLMKILLAENKLLVLP